MRVEIVGEAGAASQRAADLIAQIASETVARRGRFIIALSGGSEPWQSFRILAAMNLPWESIHVLQVDERVAPAGHPDRNLTHLRESLLDRLPAAHAHPMPVDEADLQRAAASYQSLVRKLAGSPPQFDLVHLGLGEDGHTASLVPGDAVVDRTDVDVALTGEYRGRSRMTLTLPAINRARRILWLVVGERKAAALARLLAGNSTDPAGRVRQDRAILIADRRAAKELPQHSPA